MRCPAKLILKVKKSKKSLFMGEFSKFKKCHVFHLGLQHLYFDKLTFFGFIFFYKYLKMILILFRKNCKNWFFSIFPKLRSSRKGKNLWSCITLANSSLGCGEDSLNSARVKSAQLLELPLKVNLSNFAQTRIPCRERKGVSPGIDCIRIVLGKTAIALKGEQRQSENMNDKSGSEVT